MDPVQEQVDINVVRKKAIQGIITFTGRTFFVQIFSFFATFVLTILLSPSSFGVFYIVSAVINLFVYFSDIGLAAALVQKKENPTEDDFSTAFIIQQVIIILLVVIGIIFSSVFGAKYGLNRDAILLFNALLFSLILSSLKTVPSIILERNLTFHKLVVPQIIENVVFYLTAIILAYNHFELTSFTWAVIARGVFGLIAIYVVSPWKPSFKFNLKSAKSLTHFGIPFQINSILALLKDDLLTVFVGKVLPTLEVGFIGWAQKFAFVPLRFFMDNVIKVTFPAFSRMQHDAVSLKNSVEKSLLFVTITVYPSLVAIIIVLPKLTHLIPNYSKWEGAIPLLTFFCINAAFACVNTTLTNIMFAIGKPQIILKLMIFWTFLTWILTYIFVKELGYFGVSIASAIVAASTSIVIYFVKQHIDVSIIKSIYAPSIASILTLFLLKFLDKITPDSFLEVLVLLIVLAVSYSSIILILLGKQIIKDLKVVVSSLRPSFV